MENFFALFIDELPPRLRETFILHFKEELSYQEIAEKLNISVENVRKRISQARKILKQRYNQDFLGENNSKSEVVSQSRSRKKSDEIEVIEVANNQDLELSILEVSHQEKLAEVEEVMEKPNLISSCEERVILQVAIVPSGGRRGEKDISYIWNYFPNILLRFCLDRRKLYSPEGFKISSDTGDCFRDVVNHNIDSS